MILEEATMEEIVDHMRTRVKNLLVVAKTKSDDRREDRSCFYRSKGEPIEVLGLVRYATICSDEVMKETIIFDEEDS